MKGILINLLRRDAIVQRVPAKQIDLRLPDISSSIAFQFLVAFLGRHDLNCLPRSFNSPGDSLAVGESFIRAHRPHRRDDAIDQD